MSWLMWLWGAIGIVRSSLRVAVPKLAVPSLMLQYIAYGRYSNDGLTGIASVGFDAVGNTTVLHCPCPLY